jgi:hypothetical protein
VLLHTVPAGRGAAAAVAAASIEGFAVSPRIADTVAAAVMDLGAGRDLCFVGPAGCGKSALVHYITSSVLDASVETLFLYRDMTPRDLTMRRTAIGDGQARCVCKGGGWGEGEEEEEKKKKTLTIQKTLTNYIKINNHHT